MRLLMRTISVGGEELVIGRAANREGAAAKMEADDILFRDVVHRARFNPVGHLRSGKIRDRYSAAADISTW